MKKNILLLFILLSVLSSTAQDITGQWNGLLKVQASQLRVVFHVSKTETGYRATMDSPDQGAKDIPVTTTTFENPKLKFQIANALIEYSGEVNGNEITGTFKQGGMELPLNLSRHPIEKEELKRPQEPTKPYSYYTEEVTFQNTKASISLAGTLSLPSKDGIYPVVILITGSGPQNRDEEVFTHKPFLVIADHLTKNGIGVLRYDDRGTAQSTGDFKAATSEDFATDVESAIAYLKTRKEINKNKIGLMGHSEGGIIAPMVAAKSKDVNFIVLLAGTGIRGDKLLLLQQEYIAKASGETEAVISNSKKTSAAIFDLITASANNDDKLKSDIKSALNESLKNDPNAKIPDGISQEDVVSSQVTNLLSPWMYYFIKLDPAIALEKVKCPVLAVNGEKDVQVPATENLPAIKNALTKGGNKNVTTKSFPNQNHLFQECKTGLPKEYGEIEETFSPIALEYITKWIALQVSH